MSKSENNHDNSDFQMLKEEISESEYQNAQYEAEKKKHIRDFRLYLTKRWSE